MMQTASINIVMPTKAFEWLLINYKKFNVIGRSRLVDSLKYLDFAEMYEVLPDFLNDKSIIYNENLHLLPRENHFRICDIAFETMDLLITFYYKDKKDYFKNLTYYGMTRALSIENRDKNINALKIWWNENKDNLINEKESLHNFDKNKLIQFKKDFKEILGFEGKFDY